MTQYFLGVDWGKSKIGLALADDETRLAFAHLTIKNNSSTFDILRKLIQDQNIETVVIGVPSSYKYTAEAGKDAVAFGEKMAQECSVTIEYFQEMFTTKMAQSNLIESGKQRILDDQEAARLILQEWLDMKRDKIAL